ncbi:MAG: hypothetical protein ACLQJ0_06035 [Steroidobacteraceae bacterium]
MVLTDSRSKQGSSLAFLDGCARVSARASRAFLLPRGARPIPPRRYASGNVFTATGHLQSLPERVLASQRLPASTAPILRQ